MHLDALRAGVNMTREYERIEKVGSACGNEVELREVIE